MNGTAPISRPVQAWKADLLPLPYLLLGTFMLGAYLFFLNESIPEFFQDRPGGIEWYAVFANEIFQPNSLYIAESMLLPLLAKTLGASNSLQAYRLLCAVITLLIVPALAWSARSYFRSTTKALVLTITFAVTFKYLRTYQLGFPDPLTVFLLLILVLQSNKVTQLLLVILAGLSHFSMTLLAIIGLCGCVLCLPYRPPPERYRLVKVMLLGVVISKLLLGAWGFVFRYHVDSRFLHAWQSGLSYFLDRYSADAAGFWLAPGLPHLFVLFILLLYFSIRQHVAFVLSLFASLCVAYLALFLTTDGLRVFAVVIAPTYIVGLVALISDVAAHNEQKLKFLHTRICSYSEGLAGTLRRLLAGLFFASTWWFLINRAKDRGLLVNHGDFLQLSLLKIGIADWLFFCVATLIFLVSMSPCIRAVRALKYSLKCFLLMVLLLIIVQFVRQQNPSWENFSGITQTIVFMAIALLSMQLAREKWERLAIALAATVRQSFKGLFK